MVTEIDLLESPDLTALDFVCVCVGEGGGGAGLDAERRPQNEVGHRR
jgi:hypothetical protein